MAFAGAEARIPTILPPPGGRRARSVADPDGSQDDPPPRPARPAASPDAAAISRRRLRYPASALPVSPDAPRTSTFPVTTAVMRAERYSRSRSMAVSTFPINRSSFAVSRSR